MTPSGRSRNMAARWIKDPRFSQGATTALAWLTTPAMDRTEPMHGYKTATAQASVAHQTTGPSASAGNGASCHSSVLLQQPDPISDSPGMAFGGVELVPVLGKVAVSLPLSSSKRSSSFRSRSSSLSSHYPFRRPLTTAAARSRSTLRRRQF